MSVYIQGHEVKEVRSDGPVTDSHVKLWVIEEICKLIITNPECTVPDFKSDDWKKVILVTPRNCM
jgi:hypothetical protein